MPVYADAIAEELGFVLENAGVKIAVAQDQEQVDKILSAAARLNNLAYVLYDEDRGLRDYDDPRLLSVADVMARGAKRLRTAPKPPNSTR